MGKQIVTEFDVRIPMRDGITLSATITRPNDNGKYPVLISRMPYGKDAGVGSGPADLLIDLENTAKEGYVIVLQDVRGRFASEGDWDILPCMNKECEDGEDTVNWLLRQPYCSGKVGTFGGSYMGFTQWSLMRAGQEAYAAASPTVSFATPRDGFWYRGGALELGLYSIWATSFQADTLTKQDMPEGEMTAAFTALMEDVQNYPERMKSLPLKNYALFTKNNLPDSAMEVLRQGYIGKDYCWLENNDNLYKDVRVPVLCIGGWYDVFLNGTLNNFMGVRAKAAPEIGEQSKLVVGPWAHWDRNEWLGDGYFTPNGSAYAIDLYGMNKRWFDHFLKGEENDISQQAPVKIFIMGKNEWRDEQEWPLARTRYVPYYFGSSGKANVEVDDGSLTTEIKRGAVCDVYDYDPAEPVETLGGTNLITPFYQIGPKDHRVIEARKDVLVYTTEILADDIEVTGPVIAKLWVTSSARDTDFVVRLLDVYPDGSSMILCDGITRARYRDFDKTGEVKFLKPGEATEVEVNLWATSNLFKKGHRIRVDVTSSSFPRWDRNPNTGNDLLEDTEEDFVVARQCILHDGEHASCIVLPVID